MQRITAEQVVEAYEKTGFIPVQQKWFVGGDTQFCSCALTTFCLANKPITFYKSLVEKGFNKGFNVEGGNYNEPFHHAIGVATGLPHPYVEGFVVGFDGSIFVNDFKEDRAIAEQGYLDGVKTWEAVKERFGTIIKEGLE